MPCDKVLEKVFDNFMVDCFWGRDSYKQENATIFMKRWIKNWSFPSQKTGTMIVILLSKHLGALFSRISCPITSSSMSSPTLICLSSSKSHFFPEILFFYKIPWTSFSIFSFFNYYYKALEIFLKKTLSGIEEEVAVIWEHFLAKVLHGCWVHGRLAIVYFLIVYIIEGRRRILYES